MESLPKCGFYLLTIITVALRFFFMPNNRYSPTLEVSIYLKLKPIFGFSLVASRRASR
jgi:hypothetical protein